MAEYDLTMSIIPFLDRHMVLPLLEHLQEKKLFRSRDLLAAKVELVSKTKMVDLAADEYKVLHNTKKVPAAMGEQKEAVLKQIKEYNAACDPLLELIGKDEPNEGLQMLHKNGRLTAEYLREHHKIEPVMIPALYRYAKLKFDCGMYEDAALYLDYFRMLSNDEELKFQALWGKLAAEILMLNFEQAVTDLDALKDAIDSRIHVDHLEQLKQRSWVVHWSLFVHFNLSDGCNQLITFLFQEDNYVNKTQRTNPSTDKIHNALQSACPHVLRYLTAAVIIAKKRRNVLKDLSRVLQAESDVYYDPVTEFLRCLYNDFDFDAAKDNLADCEKVLENDFFFQSESGKANAKLFMKNAQIIIFETYCRVSKTVSLTDIKDKCDLVEDGEELEGRIMELVKETGINATVDKEKKCLVMGTTNQGMYQLVMDRAKNITDRSDRLLNSIDKKYQAKANEQEDNRV